MSIKCKYTEIEFYKKSRTIGAAFESVGYNIEFYFAFGAFCFSKARSMTSIISVT
jgi:hypothetical protein